MSASFDFEASEFEANLLDFGYVAMAAQGVMTMQVP